MLSASANVRMTHVTPTASQKPKNGPSPTGEDPPTTASSTLVFRGFVAGNYAPKPAGVETGSQHADDPLKPRKCPRDNCSNHSYPQTQQTNITKTGVSRKYHAGKNQYLKQHRPSPPNTNSPQQNDVHSSSTKLSSTNTK